ncbi:MAG: hypothetical protein R2838_20680 [Caldilineaceae bacterium]
MTREHVSSRHTLMLAALTFVLAGMVGCTAIQALTLDPSTLEQQAAPAPALRQSPSYYMDDLDVIQGALPGPMPVLRQSPSYYMDDPSNRGGPGARDRGTALQPLLLAGRPGTRRAEIE